MKKLTAGIFASVLGLVAFVAHADIASTGYVDSKIGGEVVAGNTTQAPVGSTIRAAIEAVNTTAVNALNNVSQTEGAVVTGIVKDGNTVSATRSNVPATAVTEDATHRFVTDTEKSTWNDKQDAIADLATIRSNAETGAGLATTVASHTTRLNALGTAADEDVAESIAENGTGLATSAQVWTAVQGATGDASTAQAAAQAAQDAADAAQDAADAAQADVDALETNVSNNYATKVAVNGTNTTLSANDANIAASLGNLAHINMPASCQGEGARCVLTYNGEIYQWENIASPDSTGLSGAAATQPTVANPLVTAAATLN